MLRRMLNRVEKVFYCMIWNLFNLRKLYENELLFHSFQLQNGNLEMIFNNDFFSISRYNNHPMLNERYLLLMLLGKGGFSEVHKVSFDENFHVLTCSSRFSTSQLCICSKRHFNCSNRIGMQKPSVTSLKSILFQKLFCPFTVQMNRSKGDLIS